MRQLLRSLGLAMFAAGAIGCAQAGKLEPSASPTPIIARQAQRSQTPSPPSFPREALQRLLKAEESRAGFGLGVVVRDLNGGGEAVLQADRSFEAASLVKLPILVALYDGGHDLHRQMTLEERMRTGGSGVLKDAPTGGKYSLKELARLMITKSDNVATDMLLEELGMEAVEDKVRSLGLKGTTVRRKIFDFAAIDAGRDNRTTPADMALLLEKLAHGDLPGSPEMVALLSEVERKDLMVAGLPKGVTAAHKTGELTGFLHDAGIVTGARRRWVLVLMTEGGERETTMKAMVGLTRKLTASLTSE